ncbi:MAG: SymE family type I addiction module toxin [Bacteroidota bacterium]
MFGITNKSKMLSLRILKVYRKFQRRRWDHKVVPEIRLEGDWLKDLGFEIGETIEVQQEKHQLTIKLVNDKNID